jgi:uncharacterized protein (DUF1800 family)
MARSSDRYIEHLLRRAGFGARPDELDFYGGLTISDAVDAVVAFDQFADTVDANIGKSGYVGITARGAFAPQSNITDARQRWLFRMVHTNRPLQEKMTLFWHNHFATGFAKIAGTVNAAEATRYMAAKAAEDPAGVRGQIEMLRDNALGNFRDILVNIAKDVAMLFWLDGYTNTRAKPQENFAREIMELFTVGVGNYTEQDVYAGARVFTGWNLTRPGVAGSTQHYEFFYNAAQHDTGSKTFSFPIYPDGNKTIPARAASAGMQDGLDFIDGLAANPNTGRYLAGKLFKYFVSEFRQPDAEFINRIAAVYLSSGFDMKTVVREVFLTPQFWDSATYFSRYSWPVEFVVRALKDIGWVGFSVNDALTPLGNMGQNLYDPPDVSGWDAGQTWFATGAMLARMNFASTLAANQRFNLAARAKPAAASPDSFLSFFLDELVTAPMSTATTSEFLTYLRATGAWTGSDAQVQSKAVGLVHLIGGSPEYQLI